MEPVQDASVRFAIDHFSIRRWRVRCCAICDGSLGYTFSPEGKVSWDARCWCSPEGAEPVERSVGDVTATLNSGTLELRMRRWRDFLASRGG